MSELLSALGEAVRELLYDKDLPYHEKLGAVARIVGEDIKTIPEVYRDRAVEGFIDGLRDGLQRHPHMNVDGIINDARRLVRAAAGLHPNTLN